MFAAKLNSLCIKLIKDIFEALRVGFLKSMEVVL